MSLLQHSDVTIAATNNITVNMPIQQKYPIKHYNKLIFDAGERLVVSKNCPIYTSGYDVIKNFEV